jgi:hypothetical protein
MTIAEAKKKGSSLALRAAFVFVAIVLVVLLFRETKGDFSNGVLFFMQYLLNAHSWAIIFIFLLLTWLLGGIAGEVIIIKNWNFVLVANASAFLITLALISYTAFAGILKDGNYGAGNIMRLAKTYFFIPFLKKGFPLMGGLVIIWLWPAGRMWQIAGVQNKSNGKIKP